MGIGAWVFWGHCVCACGVCVCVHQIILAVVQKFIKFLFIYFLLLGYSLFYRLKNQVNMNFLSFGKELPLENVYEQLAILYKCKVLQISVLGVNVAAYL